jgi:hypothetical protein
MINVVKKRPMTPAVLQSGWGSFFKQAAIDSDFLKERNQPPPQVRVSDEKSEALARTWKRA